MHRMWLAAIAAVLALSSFSGVSWAQERDARQGARPPRFREERGRNEFRGVVVVRPIHPRDAAPLGLTERQAARAADDAVRALARYEVREYAGDTDEFLVSVPAGESESSVADALLATGSFHYVEPDWTVYPAACPNDLNFSGQWYHAANRLDSCAAWDIETGSPSVVVALCDTGIRASHTDLRLNRREGLHVPSMTWESAGGALTDVTGHGTRVSGCAAGNGNNGVGIAGIGWNLGHRMMRVTDSTTGSAALSNLLAAARAAADAGDRVASVSFTGVASSSVQTAGAYVRSKGALLVWAAGNDGITLSGNRNDAVIVVGATDAADALASFSNRGPLVDLVAPGVGVYTTSHTSDTSYASATGTSFACPLVAGLCGLVWSSNPALTPSEVEAVVRGSCTDLGASGVDDLYGHGRIDAAAALLLAGGGSGDGGGTDTTPPAIPTGVAAVAGTGAVTLTWAANTEPDLLGYRVYRSTSATVGFSSITTGAPLGATTFTDNGLAAGTRYYYAVRAEDDLGNQSRSSTIVSAVPSAASAPVTLFSDSFESGNLTAGGWTAQNLQASASTASRLTGAWGARLIGTTWMQRVRSTAGYGSITLTLSHRTVALDSGEALFIEWWDGAAWRAVATVTGGSWSTQTHALPAAAADNAAFRLRLRTNANAPAFERVDVDDVILRGTPR